MTANNDPSATVSSLIRHLAGYGPVKCLKWSKRLTRLLQPRQSIRNAGAGHQRRAEEARHHRWVSNRATSPQVKPRCQGQMWPVNRRQGSCCALEPWRQLIDMWHVLCPAGELIVGRCKTLLMDEISTGLDSSTTYQIVRCMRNVAHLQDVSLIRSSIRSDLCVAHFSSVIPQPGICKTKLHGCCDSVHAGGA